MELLIQIAQCRVFSPSQWGQVWNLEVLINQQGIYILTNHDALRVSQMSLLYIMSISGFTTLAEMEPRASRSESTTS